MQRESSTIFRFLRKLNRTWRFWQGLGAMNEGRFKNVLLRCLIVKDPVAPSLCDTNSLAQYSRRVILMDSNFLSLEAMDPPFDHDIARPVVFTVHTKRDAKSFQRHLVYNVGDPKTLVGVLGGKRTKQIHYRL